MSRLIDELRRDHVVLEGLLAKVKDNNLSSKEAHKILMSAEAAFLAHLKKEDKDLYPVLNKAGQTDSALRRNVEFYAKDMDEITAHATAFFRKYSADDAVLDIEFARALGRFFALISRRMRNEENTLYKAYDSIS